jgi:hypothetical protein
VADVAVTVPVGDLAVELTDRYCGLCSCIAVNLLKGYRSQVKYFLLPFEPDQGL